MNHRLTALLCTIMLSLTSDAWADDILTPKAPPTPRINGARVFGARPGRPFLFTIPATGTEPIAYHAEGLPDGLKLDAKLGLITGAVGKEGTYVAKLTASNEWGRTPKR